MENKIKAFIFDLDGVITDTAKFHYLAWKTLAEELGLEFNQTDNEELKGVSRMRSFEIILEKNNGLDKYTEEEKISYLEKKNEMYIQMIEEIKEEDILPNIPDFLKEAKKKGLKLAVASASKNADRVLTLLGIKESFDYIADAAKIKNAKPHPEIFLDCVKHLNLQPDECVGFEDSQAGIEAIKEAGMYAVGVAPDIRTVFPDLMVSSTEELSVDEIMKKA
ncbi:MAG: beta-phosphoglucomutase [Acetivibrio sp.]